MTQSTLAIITGPSITPRTHQWFWFWNWRLKKKSIYFWWTQRKQLFNTHIHDSWIGKMIYFHSSIPCVFVDKLKYNNSVLDSPSCHAFMFLLSCIYVLKSTDWCHVTHVNSYINFGGPQIYEHSDCT